MDSYKASITDLEGKVASRTKEAETLKYQLEQAQTKLAAIVQERAADTEALELYQERVRELELVVDPSRVRAASNWKAASSNPASPTVANGPHVGLNSSANLDEELDDATSGRTWTDMKLEIRALKREIADLKNNSADAGRVQVLETLLEDTKRSKARYEEDYLLMHREKLVLQTQLEEVRSGKSSGDGYAPFIDSFITSR
jgi:protein HOOK3